MGRIDSYVLRRMPNRVERVIRRKQAEFLRPRSEGHEVECPACSGQFSRFLPYNDRECAMCPGCGSLERHRHAWLFISRMTDLGARPQRLLHIAPEEQLGALLRAVPDLEYVTGDLLRDDVDLKLDVTALDLSDDSFDAVLCMHVLEHVTDDALAMRELKRILKPGGWAILDAPVDFSRADTFEDWSVTRPRDRERVFGQFDHVRIYGRNFPNLLEAAGWTVVVDPLNLTPDDARRYGITERGGHLFVGYVDNEPPQ